MDIVKIDVYIEEYEKLLFRRKEQLKNNSFSEEHERLLKHNIYKLENYIKGLKDARKIMKESEEKWEKLDTIKL